MVLETVFVAAYAIPTMLIVIQVAMLRGFLAATPAIAGEGDMESFKRVARKGMYLTVIAMPCFLAGVVACVLLARKYGLRGLATVLVVNGIFFTIGKLVKRQEDRVRSLDAATAELAAERDRIAAAWVQKMFPDF